MKIWMLLFVLALSVFLSAQEFLEQSQERAMAVRAARLDALRQIGETIKGVRINSSTTVSNFVTENDQVSASFEGFIKGAQQLEDPKLLPDGTCEVVMGITLDEVIFGLKEMWSSNSNSRYVSSPDQFDQIRQNEERKIFKATGSGAMKSAVTVTVTENLWNRVTSQGKAMAIRGARMDAYRNMAETLQGVKIDSKTTVKDFVTQSDVIKAGFEGFVRGVEFVGEPRFLPEGIVEVSAQVDMDKLAFCLQGLCQQNYQGNQWNSNAFQNMASYNSGKIIKTTGSCAPPKFTIRAQPVVPPVTPGTGNTGDIGSSTGTNTGVVPPPPEPYVPEWARRTIRVTGTGARPENMPPDASKLLARRAAQLDAYRMLVEQIMGLKLKSVTNVQDFVTKDDTIKTKVDSYLRGATVVSSRDMDDGTAEVVMELYLGDMWQIIVAKYQEQFGKY